MKVRPRDDWMNNSYQIYIVSNFQSAAETNMDSWASKTVSIFIINRAHISLQCIKTIYSMSRCSIWYTAATFKFHASVWRLSSAAAACYFNYQFMYNKLVIFMRTELKYLIEIAFGACLWVQTHIFPILFAALGWVALMAVWSWRNINNIGKLNVEDLRTFR